MFDENHASAEDSQTTGVVSRTKTLLLSLVVGTVALVQPAAAQGNVCETQMGGFIEAVTSSVGTIAVAAILLAILVGVAARPFVRSGTQASALNNIMSKAFAGLVILIIAIPIITWGLSFTPFGPSLSCVPFLGG